MALPLFHAEVEHHHTVRYYVLAFLQGLFRSDLNETIRKRLRIRPETLVRWKQEISTGVIAVSYEFLNLAIIFLDCQYPDEIVASDVGCDGETKTWCLS